jgi:hypothetical protein
MTGFTVAWVPHQARAGGPTDGPPGAYWMPWLDRYSS